jgi:conflict system pore-forming effector with SLATT domain
MTKPDISTKQLAPWDEYKNKNPDEALASIHKHVEATSLMMCKWYWTSIRTKRLTSLAARWFAFGLFVGGTVLPICAALQDAPKDRLLFTQWAVALLAVAGPAQLADRVFGWSSGWIRYITTVTTMENLTRAFQLEWAKYILSKTPLDASDVKVLFELAKGLEQELTKLQADETTKWVAEFNTGTSLLESMIKSQREEADKKLDAIRTSLSTQEKANLPGAIEVTLTHESGIKPVLISLDKEGPVKFVGPVWSMQDIPPGQHTLSIQTESNPPQTTMKVIEVAPGGVARVEVKVG